MKSTPLHPGTLVLVCLAATALAAAPQPIPLWPGQVPGETAPLPPEADQTKPTDALIAGRRIIKLGNISIPTIAIYKPDPAKDTGAAVIVSPGGGYSILAMDLEGTEICEWLNSIGVTGVLLKYRVPRRTGLPRHAPALQDAQRAVGLVRHRAAEFGLDPKRIGMLGFSAGAHLTAALTSSFAERTYPAVDDADKVSCRPDFAVLIYPGSLTQRDKNEELAPELSVVAGKTPPTILVQAEDDNARVENALFYYLALKKAGVPAELHLYPTGGHGYGLRRSAHDVTTWPDRVHDWMKTGGWLKATR